ncbi:tyrosine kinase catalytic domain protein, partial [Rhizoctonia solani 123E]
MLRDLVEHGCVDLTSLIEPSSYSEYPRHGGGYGDIYKGKMGDGRDIAVKVWRCFSGVDPSLAMKRSMREIYNWSKLKQENIHELLGVTQHRDQLGMVSLWMDHGDLSTYIFNNPDVNRNPWCIQVATGVSYLHKNETACQILCNILLSSDFIAKISDFDCSLVTNASMTFSATRELRNTLRWTVHEAPELLNDSDSDESTIIKKTKESDIYALAMEIKTGRVPYAEYRDNNRVLKAMLQRRPPKRPKELDESSDEEPLWNLLMRCWNHDQTARPDAQVVLKL